MGFLSGVTLCCVVVGHAAGTVAAVGTGRGVVAATPWVRVPASSSNGDTTPCGPSGRGAGASWDLSP